MELIVAFVKKKIFACSSCSHGVRNYCLCWTAETVWIFEQGIHLSKPRQVNEKKVFFFFFFWKNHNIRWGKSGIQDYNHCHDSCHHEGGLGSLHKSSNSDPAIKVDNFEASPLGSLFDRSLHRLTAGMSMSALRANLMH